ncbi:TetR/AcrR family transcriptional regulator [Qipengyuania qiaonensis]|uniref:TetR/AcrR family transcriptional regulator n=1 Tax=Qipengyuania qiaonensis TaxID=2867240 RepID=A0ABS7J9N3_9SPHN|nr:TetR/AcrR family transcriptional regulator [Qipengyuania qiaonensis]MBX7484025.1 TetR/AcrR family transcriptional regulator [Qipengyuania qiaonensis]
MQQQNRRTNPQRTAATRARLVATARSLFVEQGFSRTSTPAIVAAAGVTRGALYHHFTDKQAIFRAVVEAESQAVANAIDDADDIGLSALDGLLVGARAYVDAMQIRGRVELLLIEGPAVLGREQMRRIEAHNGDASLQSGLVEAMNNGHLVQMPIDELTSVLSAMFERAAMEIYEGRSLSRVLDVVEGILRGLSGRSVS